jgi:hypothetical protein
MSTHPLEHLLIYEPDHVARAKELLLAQHRDKARINAFVAALAKGVQLAENTIWAVIVGATTIQGAEGINLDRWGALVGEFRGGLSNEDYRRFIELRLLANTRFPNEDLLYELVSRAVAPSTVEVFPMPPGGLQFLVRSPTWLPDSIVAHTAALIRDARSAGRILPIVETVPLHFALDWEDGGTVITEGTGGAVVSRLIYSGRGPA